MSGFIMHFVSGDAFFSGIFLLLVSAVMSFHKSAVCGESGAGPVCRAQRDMAEKHGVALIPRRIFAGVLEGKDSTMDGIHLSNRGHEKMARVFMEICGEMLTVQE
jgi:hypothetical protein